jgi:hypothetical protein
MRAAWEWRGFWAARAPTGLLELATPLAGRLGTDAPSRVVAEDDLYIVLPGQQHNLKLRRGALELKVLARRLPDGYSLWQDKQVWRFPLDREDSAQLWRRLPEECRQPIARLDSPEELIWHLTERGMRPEIVPVGKRRVRLRWRQARLELAHLELPHNVRMFSACAEGRELDWVRKLVTRSRLPVQGRSLSYVELLQEAAWWSPWINRSEDLAA